MRVIFLSIKVALVGLNHTFLWISEDVDVVELCAVVVEPQIHCQISFPIDVSIATRHGSAGMIQ